MSVITFMNRDAKENGQTLSVAAMATNMAIEHNYKILVIATDFNDNTLEDCFFNRYEQDATVKKILGKNNTPSVIADGLEGLVRIFATGRASKDILGDYTKPILNGRLDLLPSAQTKDFKNYMHIAEFFPQIIEVANTIYDMVIVDLYSNLPGHIQKRILDISTLVVVEILQNKQSVQSFLKLKMANEFFRKKNVVIAIGKYNPNSQYSAKNIGRMLNEKNVPIVIPYNILFADNCSDGRIVDYFLELQQIQKSNIGKDNYFFEEIDKTAERIDYLRKEVELGI